MFTLKNNESKNIITNNKIIASQQAKQAQKTENIENTEPLFEGNQTESSRIQPTLEFSYTPIKVVLVQESIALVCARFTNTKGIKTIAKGIMGKSANISQNLFNKMSDYMANAMANLPKDATTKDVEDALKNTEHKLESLEKEAVAKLEILEKLSFSLYNTNYLMGQLEKNNMDSSKITKMMNDFLTGVNTNPTDISKSKSPEESDKEIYNNLNNMYGPDTTDKFDSKKETIQDKIDELKKKLEKEDLSDNEKETIKLQLDIYTFEFELLDFITEKIKEFKSNNQ